MIGGISEETAANSSGVKSRTSRLTVGEVPTLRDRSAWRLGLAHEVDEGLRLIDCSWRPSTPPRSRRH